MRADVKTFFQSPKYKYGVGSGKSIRVLILTANPFHIRQILRTGGGQFVPPDPIFNLPGA
jgi:hypothetical protein